MPNQTEIIAAIEQIAREHLNLRAPVADIGAETVLMKGGLGLDSFSIVELVSQLESRFDFEFDESDFREENFLNIGSLGRLVQRHVDG